ncbi:MAG: hypothetical protein ACKO96_08250, partial [Flammeovirgaceae bacterium]
MVPISDSLEIEALKGKVSAEILEKFFVGICLPKGIPLTLAGISYPKLVALICIFKQQYKICFEVCGVLGFWG